MAGRKDEKTQEEPGYCIGHFDKSDKACEMCEIQEECMALTADAGDVDEEAEQEKEEDDGEEK